MMMKGTDFCTIGDSWLAIPGSQVTTLENHLKTMGVIPSGDHFEVRVSTAAFAGKTLVEQHQLVYRALGKLMPQIHALSLRTEAP